RPPIVLSEPLLFAGTAYFTYGHPLDSDFVQCSLHVIQLLRPDERLYLGHCNLLKQFPRSACVLHAAGSTNGSHPEQPAPHPPPVQVLRPRRPVERSSLQLRRAPPVRRWRNPERASPSEP